MIEKVVVLVTIKPMGSTITSRNGRRTNKQVYNPAGRGTRQPFSNSQVLDRPNPPVALKHTAAIANVLSHLHLEDQTNSISHKSSYSDPLFSGLRRPNQKRIYLVRLAPSHQRDGWRFFYSPGKGWWGGHSESLRGLYAIQGEEANCASHNALIDPLLWFEK